MCQAQDSIKNFIGIYKISAYGRLCGYRHNLPAFTIDPYDFFFRKFRVGTDESNPVFLVVTVTDTYYLGWNLLFLSDHDIHRKKILATTSVFLANAKNLPDEAVSQALPEIVPLAVPTVSVSVSNSQVLTECRSGL